MLHWLSTYSIEIWLILGLFLILIEFTQLPGIGLIFVGFGAFTTVLLLNFYPTIANYQIITLGVSSVLWLLLLWRPMRSFHTSKNSGKNQFHIIGSTVQVVKKDINPGEMGQVFWSGTIMNARLTDGSVGVKIGDYLQVVEVKGNVLICTTL